MSADIPVVILCGGKGTRMKEETDYKPKPLVLIGGKPIVWHIMMIYAHYGFRNFILALGYKGDMIKNYFLNERLLANDFTLDTANNAITLHSEQHASFCITFADTGIESLTGLRLLHVRKYIPAGEFMVTYGDGVADINITDVLAFHRRQQTIATITGVYPHSKYGLISLDRRTNLVTAFDQKPRMHDFISGGFIVLNQEAFSYLDEGPMEDSFVKLMNRQQLSIYQHEGFWKAMDTYREVEEMQELWKTSRPWAIWEKTHASA